MKRLSLLAILWMVPTLLGAAAPAAVPLADAPESCPAPSAAVPAAASARAFAEALAAPRDIDVLAVGSAAMLGPAGLPRSAFTYRAIDILALAHPAKRIALVARNVRGALATDMLATLRSELAAHPYPLVLWQAGSVEALRAIPLPVFRDTLNEGAKLVAQAHGSLVLIDTQYSRLMQSKVDVQPYEDVMRDVAAESGATLFPRYALTRDWVNAGDIDIEQARRDRRQEAADRLNQCLGHALASLLDGKAAARR